MEKIKTIAIILFLTTLLIFSISLIVAGSAHPGIPKHLEYQNCTIESQELLSCLNGGWINTWNGGSIVENIFSVDNIQKFSDKYDLNNTYKCLCNSIIQPIELEKCDTSNLCYLDIQTMKYVQNSEMIFKYGSDAMISIGSLILVFLFVFAIVICHKNRRNNFVYILKEEEKNNGRSD